LATNNFINRIKKNCHPRTGQPLWINPSEQDEQVAQDTLAWVKDFDTDGLNDYMHNLYVTLSPGTVRQSQFGIAASAVMAYQRANQDRIERESQSTNEFYGETGDKVELTLKVFRVFSYDNDWGTVHKHIFRDEDGRTFIWKATNGTDLNQETTYKIRGTIRGHEDTKYGKQTILTRCKAQEA
jgi:hypothetical protein